MSRAFDCVVAGSCVADILCRPVDLSTPLGIDRLVRTQPIDLTPGGITSNAGFAMARLGQRVAVLTGVGTDPWGKMLRDAFQHEHIDTTNMLTFEAHPTSTSVVLVDVQGDRSFLHHGGAHRQINKHTYLDRMDLWRQTAWLLLGYYPLMPNLQEDLPEVFAALREAGCRTALDASGDGTMQPLQRILPHLDCYFPSLAEAQSQTGEADPQRMIDTFRACGAPGIVGVKLGGMDGVLLQTPGGQTHHVPSVTPPAPVVDTTGAGDVFFGTFLAGLNHGLTPPDAARLGTAAAALSTTAVGGTTRRLTLPEAAALAGLSVGHR